MKPNLQGKTVELINHLRCCGTGIPAGLVGRVEWDEGGEEVIVEFDREIPDGGLGLPDRQSWVPRSSLIVKL